MRRPAAARMRRPAAATGGVPEAPAGNKKQLPEAITREVALVHRVTGIAEAYLQERGVGSGRYVVGLTISKTERYLDIMTACKDKIDAGELTTRSEVRKWVAEQL
eukprot:3846471-Pyramimonas_sp.AAC.1